MNGHTEAFLLLLAIILLTAGGAAYLAFFAPTGAKCGCWLCNGEAEAHRAAELERIKKDSEARYRHAEKEARIAAAQAKAYVRRLDDWTPTSQARPAEGVVVEAVGASGHVQHLVFEKGVWWFPDRSMYVDFEPILWRHRVATDPA